MMKHRLPNLQNEIVTRDASIEWGDLWGWLPDPDPVLLKAGVDVTVFDQLLSDAHVFACYQSRKAGILTSEYKIEYPKGSEKVARFFDGLLKNLPIDDIIASVLDAPFYGFSVNEIIWKESAGKWVPEKIEQKPNEWFVFDKLNRIRFLHKDHQTEGLLLPNYKFLVARNFPSFKNPYGMRILSRCFWPVAFKKGGYKFWTMFLEKFGIPWLLGKVPRDTKKEETDKLLSMLESMLQNAVAVINDDESVEVLQAKANGSGTSNVFADMVNSANGEISKAILTQTLTTEIGTKGAYAASQSHLSIRSDICSMDKRIVSAVFNQLFRWICELNFDVKVYPLFRFIEEDDAKEAHARRDTQLSGQGVRFTPEYYQRTYNLRPDEFKVEKPEQTGDPNQIQDRKENQQEKDQRLKDHKDPKKKTDRQKQYQKEKE